MSDSLTLTDFDRRLIALISTYEAARTFAYQAPDAARSLAEAEHRMARDQLGRFLVEVRTYRCDGIEYTARRKGASIEIERMRVGNPPRHTNLTASRPARITANRKTKAKAEVEG